VARIVPARELVAEVRIDPKDSGHIHAEADAEIRLLTFDSAIFGVVRGKVEYVSATTFNPPSGQTVPGQNSTEPYYRGYGSPSARSCAFRDEELSDNSGDGLAGAHPNGLKIDSDLCLSLFSIR
jgi:hypothetical protein